MTDETPTDVLGALPRTRPHRRSDKRAALGTQATPPKSEPTVAKLVAPKAKAEAKAKAEPKAKAGPTRKPAAKAKPASKPTALRDASAVRTPRPDRLNQPAQPAGTPPRARARGAAGVPPRRPRPVTPPRRTASPTGTEILGTAVQAAAELAEIGLTASARALRNALSRLPRP